MRIFFVLVFLFNIVVADDLNDTKIQTEIQTIDNQLNQFDFFIKYKNYQKLLILKQKIAKIKRDIYHLRRKRRSKQNIEKIENLNLQKIAYEKQLEIMQNGKTNLFDSVISIKDLPKPFKINNPFEIFRAINYINNLHSIISSYEKKDEELTKILDLLHKKEKLKDNEDIKRVIQDFELIKTIYDSKLKQLKIESKLYIQTMKDYESKQIVKLVTLIIVIFISILFFTLLKLAFRKYAQNLENIYLINKIINFFNISVAILIVAFFYIDNATYLITILGFASAGIAIAMKDWFMNIFGWIVILITGNFKVGDRIRVILQNGNVDVIGDIIDITTSRIVIQEDVTLTTFKKNRRAGRIIFVPNNVVFTNAIFNYTHNGLKSVWDGIDIVITFDSNYKKAEYLAKEITKQYSKGYTDITRKQLNKLRSVYNIRNTQVEPRIYTFIGEYGIIISCWYLNNYATLALRSKISSELLDAFLKEDDIKIAYNTLNIKMKNEQTIQTKTPISTDNV